MDLKPTKKRVGYSIILSMFISMLFFGFYAQIDRKPLEIGLLSPAEFHLIYVVPMLSFLASYFIVCWFVLRGTDKPLIKQIK